MNREELINVFLDTKSRVESGEYESELVSDLLNLSDVSRVDFDSLHSNISVVNADCIDISNTLSKSGKTCLLNMASYKRPGGGVRNGSMAQEEELARRSNLVWGLPIEYYPLSESDFIYTEGVTFFKDRNYNIIDQFQCDVITMAAVNLNGMDKPHNYKEITESKIFNIIDTPRKYGCKNLVLSALGCGVFKNDPYYIASTFKKFFDVGLNNYYNRIIFAIINDPNSVSSNYQIFKEVLEG